jgi:mannonate dehydratase
MRQAWRWFGPNDPVTLDTVRQAGATDIVSSLHHVPPGEAWTLGDVERHRALIETTPPGRSPLMWSVVESIPVPDDVKRYGAGAKQSIAAWIASLEAAAQGGLKIICYNFMPVVDWTRTDLDWPLPTGGTALRFDQDAFAAFDLYILKRPDAEASYDREARERAKAVADGFDDAAVERLTKTIAAGLPGATTDALSLEAFRDRLAAYRGIDADTLRRHLIEFLEQVTPVADKLSVKLTLHPDDPPRPLFGLPRVASTEEDYAALFSAVPSPANGMCYCTGSLGVRADNDLPAIARRFASRIHFAHLRATRREADGLSFYEADHLEGDVDMVAVLDVLLREDRQRPESDKIPFRPDHGHRILDDLASDRRINPGYTAIGRLKGLAELRGVMKALDHREAGGEGYSEASS